MNEKSDFDQLKFWLINININSGIVIALIAFLWFATIKDSYFKPVILMAVVAVVVFGLLFGWYYVWKLKKMTESG